MEANEVTRWDSEGRRVECAGWRRKKGPRKGVCHANEYGRVCLAPRRCRAKCGGLGRRSFLREPPLSARALSHSRWRGSTRLTPALEKPQGLQEMVRLALVRPVRRKGGPRPGGIPVRTRGRCVCVAGGFCVLRKGGF